MLGWLIIGGGVHGTYLSHYLTVTGRTSRDRLRVLDPHAAPLARWHRWTTSTATEWLRSPGAHHLDVGEDALVRFAATPIGRAAGDFVGRRPSTSLFAAHVDAIVEQHALAALRITGTASRLVRRPGGWRVETAAGAIEARRVALAIGPDGRPREPAWTRSLRALGARVEHVLAPEFRRDAIGARERVAVVGGGISAAQLALALSRRQASVTLITRHAPRVQPLDADAVWFERWTTPAFARGDLRARRALLGFGRHPGSMPRDVADRLAAATRAGRLTIRIGEVARASALPDGGSKLVTLDHDVTVDRVVLATGFDPARPGGSWLTRAILDQGLPTAPCGYPIADAQLAWQPGLHVTGPLGELQLGAAARSIAGARRAAELLGTVG